MIPLSPFFRIGRWLTGLISSVLCCAVLAQPSGARGDDFIYRVLLNDTLIDLSTRFTGTPNNWATLQSLNQVDDPTRLPVGLELRIPFVLIPEVAAQASVIHISGNATLNNSPAQIGDSVQEGDTLRTQPGSFLTFRLPDASVAAVPGDSTLQLTRMRTFQGTGLVDTILDLTSGAVETTVAPEGTGTGRYEIRTPVSITGVRGTRLRVRNDDTGARSEVLSGQVQLGHDRADGPRIGANQGTTVTPQGRIMPVRALLPAPVLHADALTAGAGQLLFEPVDGATGYLVRVAADASGTQPVSTQTVAAPPARYQAPGAGTWYVLVRAIDAQGLMGPDAAKPFEGRLVLNSGFGLPIQSGHGSPVVLNHY